MTWLLMSLQERRDGQLRARAAGPQHLKEEEGGQARQGPQSGVQGVPDWDVDPWVQSGGQRPDSHVAEVGALSPEGCGSLSILSRARTGGPRMQGWGAQEERAEGEVIRGTTWIPG